MAMAACWQREGVAATEAGRSLLLLLAMFLALSAIPLAAGYGLDEFLAALKNETLTYHEVQGDVVLNASLPDITGRDFTLVGRAPGGKRPVIDGASMYGGASSLSLTLKNLEFVNFSGTQSLFSVAGDIDIQDCIFRSNIGSGSTIDVFSGDVTISRSFFLDNQVVGFGGRGAAVSSVFASSVAIESTVFRNNLVKQASDLAEGGGLSINIVNHYTITNCTFEGNEVDGIGGAIASFGCDRGEILGSSFVRNSAYSTTRFYKQYATGGAIDIYGDKVTIISGCTFTGNKAEGRRGGAVSLSMYQAEATISGSEFAENAAGTYGGAVGVRLVPAIFAEGGRIRMLGLDDEPPRGEAKFCRENTYSRNAAGTSGAENIYVDMHNSSGSGVSFCPSRPPLALIEANPGTVTTSCASCRTPGGNPTFVDSGPPALNLQ